MSGMTGAGGEFGNIPRTLFTMPSCFVLAYFALSFAVALVVASRAWRFWFACLAHSLLAASIVAIVLPALSGDKDAAQIRTLICITLLLYGFLFAPWIIIWRLFVKRGREAETNGSRTLQP
jgi:chromate transport protein ChrA